mmetsp:Transcript_3735/g.9717  ORF Transcript_3735/g.9717 Transcript_3735/m.9717 type:complete len:115 (+) Transcript_3735:622-966(+)
MDAMVELHADAGGPHGTPYDAACAGARSDAGRDVWSKRIRQARSTASTCEPGTHYPVGTSSAAAELSPDEMLDETCEPCPSGTVSGATGATTCEPCPAGSYAQEDGTARTSLIQ